MQMTDNTILITGGGSGIGRALAEAFFRLGNQVIIAGRRQALLDEVAAANPGMHSAMLDIADGDDIRGFAERMQRDHPTLNVVIQNAGIMREERVLQGGVADAEATVMTNLLGPIRLTAALLPMLIAQARATIVTVSSGLAFAPRALMPTYCATKAAIHSYSQSLRYQLKDTSVQVIELIPPYVQTELMGEHQATDPMAMPLPDFIAEVMDLFATGPDADEIRVQRVLPQRLAPAGGDYDAFFKQYNDRMMSAIGAR